MANLKQKNENQSTILENRLKVILDGSKKEISFKKIDEILNDQIRNKSTSIKKSAKVFTLTSKNQIVIKVTNIDEFATNFAYFLKQKYYFTTDSVFKMYLDNGQLKLVKIE